MEPEQPDLSQIEPVESPALTKAIPPAPPTYPPSPNPFQLSPMPASQVLQPDTLRSFFRPGGAPQTRNIPQPPAATPAIGASAASQAVTIIQQGQGVVLETNNVRNHLQGTLNLQQGSNIALTADAFGGVTITGTAGGDGLAHGETVVTTPGSWESDPAYSIIREDFWPLITGSSTPTSGTTIITPSGWIFANTSGLNSSDPFEFIGGTPPNLGQLLWENNASANTVTGSGASATITLANAGSVGAGSTQHLLPLLDYPSWKATFVFKFDTWLLSTSAASFPAFSKAKTSFYIGLTGENSLATSSRPHIFAGLRFDTDPGWTFALTAAANASGGTTTYTGTITGSGTNTFLGQSFTVSGFGNANNNGGPWICTASSSTTITLKNPNGVSQSGATATAQGTALSDSHFVFEAVSNPAYASGSYIRDNTQGTTQDSGVTPTAGVWHRLDIVCTTAGQLQMSLDGGSLSTLSMPPMTLVLPINGSGTAPNVSASNGQGTFNWTNNINFPPVDPVGVFANGSKFTVSGITTAGLTVFNGNWTALGCLGGTSIVFSSGSLSSAATATNGYTISGYPGLSPFATFGNSTEASPVAQSKAFFVDFFSLIWNPGIGTSPAANKTKARYF